MTSSNPSTVITSTATTFFRLFCTGRFTVPWHQRRYDWQPDHVDELLQDLAEALNAGRRCYFLGTIILVRSASAQWRINDGQQRMVTLSLISACMLRLFLEHHDSHRAHIALRILFDIDENTTDALDNLDRLTPRLTPPRDDKTRYNLMSLWLPGEAQEIQFFGLYFVRKYGITFVWSIGNRRPRVTTPTS